MTDTTPTTGAENADAIVDRLRGSRERLEQRAARLSVKWRGLVPFAVAGGVVFGLLPDKPAPKDPVWWVLVTLGVAFGAGLYVVGLAYMRAAFRLIIRTQDQLLGGATITHLQETLEDDFFTKLVKINFKYIDQYYLQTQAQADKSFTLSAFVGAVGLATIIAGIALMYTGKTQPAYVSAAAGVLAEFIAAVFFYLYNRTVLKMSEYHQKLVITQNIGLALKIAEGLPESQRFEAQRELINRLTEDINRHLVSLPGSVKTS